MATIEELQQQVAALSAQVAAITAPPTDYYTSQYSGEEIDQGVGRALPGGEIDLSLANVARALPGGEIDAALNSKMEIEFLDNTDFTNPIAQAGIGGMHGSVAYALDRWKLISGTVSASSNGLTLNGTIRQIREFPIGFPAVPSIEMHSGTATITYDDSTKYCDIVSSGGVIKRPHLGLTAITDWSKMPMPKHDAEFLWCRKYLPVAIKTGDGQYASVGVGAAIDGTTIKIQIPMPVPPRTAPVLDVSGISNLLLRGGGFLTPSAVSIDIYSENSITLSCTVSPCTAGDAYELIALPGVSLLILADL